MILVLTAAAFAQQPPAIVNGVLATDVDFPETVLLSTGSGTCSGSLIHPEWVLTAAHCVVPDPGSLEVGFGTQLGLLTDVIPAAEWIVHPTYVALEDSADGVPHDDVALVRLSRPKTDVLPMSLNPDPVDDGWLGLDVTFSGYGLTSAGGTSDNTKRYVDVPIIGFTPTILSTFDGTHSTCQGDSGGPGVLYKGAGYVQVAVTSYGVECGEGASGAMRVDAYLPWIGSNGVEVRTTPASPPTFDCSHVVGDEAVAVVPFELHCAVSYPDMAEIKRVTWAFGDGSEQEGLAASHTYTEAGQYNVQACFEGESGAGTWSHCAFRSGYVRACDQPDARFSAVPSDRPGEPLTIDLINETAVDPYGCVQDLQWEVFGGSDTSGVPLEVLTSGWSPRYTFDEHGQYTVVLHVGGIGGTGSAALTVDTRSGSGLGCSHAPTGAVFAWLGGLLVLVRRRGR